MGLISRVSSRTYRCKLLNMASKFTPIQRAEIRIRKLERLYDEQHILIENYKDCLFGNQREAGKIPIKILYKHKEEYGEKIKRICGNIEKFVLECEQITNKVHGKNIPHISIGLEKTNIKKFKKDALAEIGYQKWSVFRSNKQLSDNKYLKCFEQDIWILLRRAYLTGLDDSIVEQKLEYIFSEDRLSDFYKASGMTIKNHVFFKHPTPKKEDLEVRRKHVDVQGESNPYKTAEKTKVPLNKMDDSSDSDIVPAPKKNLEKEKKRLEKEAKKKEKKEKRLRKENELREKERAERERKKKQKLQKINKAGDSSSSDENAIIPNKPDKSESEMDSDVADMLPTKKSDNKPKHQKKTKPSGINMDDSSSDDEKPKKATLPPKPQPNLAEISSSSDDFTPMHKPPAKTTTTVVGEKPKPDIKPKKPKKDKKDKERSSSNDKDSKKPKKFKSSLN